MSVAVSSLWKNSEEWRKAFREVLHTPSFFAMRLRLPAGLALAATLSFALSAFADEPILPGIGAAMREVVAKNEEPVRSQWSWRRTNCSISRAVA